jgi:hypothetical protein
MSYDLFFEPRQGVFEPALFGEFFRSRKHYQISDREAIYDNKDTGVCFVFNLDEPKEFEGELRLSATFKINYFRPSYFILEAEPEVTAFVRHFDMIVFDPQTDGMEEDDYQSQLLIRGWNSGNAYAYRTFIRDRKRAGDLPALPTATLMESWKWNLGRDERQSQFGEAKFVPCIVFLRIDGNAKTAAVWPDGLPTVLPPVDYLIIVRRQLIQKSAEAEDFAFLPWDAARLMLDRHGSIAPGGAVVLDYDLPPPDVREFLLSLPGHADFALFAPGEVLDRELLEKYA